MTTTALTPQMLRRILRYESDTGKLFWLKRVSNNVHIGDEAGSRLQDNRKVIHIQGKSYKAYRIAWAIHYGEWPKGLLDHIDKDCTNDRITNLRETTYIENSQNHRLYAGNKSGYSGVSLDRDQWRARPKIFGKRVCLGRYSTPEEANDAIEAYKARL